MAFHQGLCECFNECPVVIDVLCCTMCQLGHLCSASRGVPHSMDCLTCCCGGIVFPCIVAHLRCEASNKYGLMESSINSCLLGWCCPGLSMCQLNHEFNYRGVNPGGCCCREADIARPVIVVAQPQVVVAPSPVYANGPGYGGPGPAYGAGPGYGPGPAYGAGPGYGPGPAYGAPAPVYGAPPVAAYPPAGYPQQQQPMY